MVDNREVAAILEEVANILEILGDNPYKIRAYRRASQTICELGDDLEDIWRQGKLRTVDGIGKDLQSKIEEILQTGSLNYHHELLDRVPRGVLRMLELPGLGPRTVRLFMNTWYYQSGRSAGGGQSPQDPGTARPGSQNRIQHKKRHRDA